MITVQEIKTNAESFSEYKDLTPEIFEESIKIAKDLKKLGMFQ